MWELDHKEGWVPKNWCFQSVALEMTLEVPLYSKEIKPVDPKEINSEYSLEGLMLKLKITCGHLMWRADSLEKTLILGKTEGRRRGRQRMRRLDGIIDTMDLGLSKFWEIVKDRETWHAAVHWVAKSRMWFSDWTTIKPPNESWEMNNKIIKTLLWNIKYLNTIKMCVVSCQCCTDNWFILWLVPKHLSLSICSFFLYIFLLVYLFSIVFIFLFTKMSSITERGISFQILGCIFVTELCGALQKYCLCLVYCHMSIDTCSKVLREKWKWKSLSHVWLFATPCIIQSMEFSRPEYWSG